MYPAYYTTYTFYVVVVAYRSPSYLPGFPTVGGFRSRTRSNKVAEKTEREELNPTSLGSDKLAQPISFYLPKS
jgi:hypothetical protein